MSKYYENPLIKRYASKQMSEIFSDDSKFSTWRKLWVALAESEKELGLNITEEQIIEMQNNIYDIDYVKAAEYEKKLRHDVMAHVHTYGDACPSAKGIIHLGATSAYVGDNTDIILMREALYLVRAKLVALLRDMKTFALEYKDLPTLGFTHFQPAQLVTVGKRMALWMNDLLLDFEELEFVLDTLRMRGVKGTTGTQASFLSLFDGDHEKVKALDVMVTQKFGFKESMPVTGQTYSRKADTRVLNLLAQIAQSLHKMTNDLRLLQHLKEIEEPFEKNQIGSSAMAYKRNPMRSERIASLSRLVMSHVMNPMMTASTQWFERTLDDSANRRISIPESFLAVDSILDITRNVVDGLVVYEKMITRHVMAELPFMATENILMEAVTAGGDRQELHEKIRILSMEAGKRVKVDGLDNDLLDRIAADPEFKLSQSDLINLMDPSKYIGRSSEQTVEFIEQYIDPILEKYSDATAESPDLKV